MIGNACSGNERKERRYHKGQSSSGQYTNQKWKTTARHVPWVQALMARTRRQLMRTVTEMIPIKEGECSNFTTDKKGIDVE